MPLVGAIPIIFGANVGTAATAVLAGRRAERPRRAASPRRMPRSRSSASFSPSRSCALCATLSFEDRRRGTRSCNDEDDAMNLERGMRPRRRAARLGVLPDGASTAVAARADVRSRR